MERLFSGQTKEFQAYVPVNLNFSVSSVLPTLDKTASTLLPRFLGDALSQQLTSLNSGSIDQATPDGAVQWNAMDLTRAFVAKLGFAAYLIFAQVQIDNDGITVTAGEGRRAAFDYQTKELKSQLQEDGWQALDDLLKLLSTHSSLFPGWESSPYLTQYRSDLFLTPAAFSQFYPIQDRWLTYWALVPFMHAIEERIGEAALARIAALPSTVGEPKRARLRRSLLRALAYEVILLGLSGLSIEINGTNVQLNYASQYGGKESYYTPPGREMLDWVSQNLRAQLAVFWETFENAIAPLESGPATPVDDGLGLLESDGSFVMI